MIRYQKLGIREWCQCWSVVVIAIAGAASTVAAQPPAFISINVVNPGQIRATYARATSDDGAVVVGFSDTNWTSPPDPGDFLWTRNPIPGSVLLRNLDGVFLDARVEQMSGNGQVLVGRSPYWNWEALNTFHQAFAWSQSGGFQHLPDLPNGVGDLFAAATSFDGGVVVGRGRTIDGTQPVRWTAAEGAVGLGTLAGGTMNGEATDVSADGSVIVGVSDSADGLQAFRWTSAGGLVGLGRLPGTIQSRATAVSSDGLVVVGASRDAAGNDRAFRWTAEGGMADLGNLPEGSSTRAATAVSANGDTIVGSARTPTTGDIGFVWTHIKGMRSLPAMLSEDYGMGTGTWYATTVRDLSPNGRFMAGESVQHNDPGIVRGWVVTLPPFGDVSLDGQVTVFDLPIFVAYLTQPIESLSARDRNLSDINRDGMIDGRDIAGFAALLVGSQ